MSRYDSNRAQCLVYAYGERGLLRCLSRDFEIRVDDFWVDGPVTREGPVDAEFDATSMHVIRAISGRGNTVALKLSVRDRIDEAIGEDVVRADRFPKIRFEGYIYGNSLDGTVFLNGHENQIVAVAKREADQAVVEVRINQLDFGIKPTRPTSVLGRLDQNCWLR